MLSGYVYSRHGSLVIASNAADERSLQHALRRLDPDLVLTWDIDTSWDRPVWKVHKVISRDRPAELIYTHRGPGGEPLPLTEFVLDEVRRLHPDARIPAETADEHNARARADDDKRTYEEAHEVARDLLPRIKGQRTTILPRGQHLRLARDKRRARGENV